MKKYTLSKKKVSALYGVVHEEVMRTRIRIAHLLLTNASKDEIDNALSDLCKTAPQGAIDLFIKK